jgi:hypothetical protein
VIGRNDDGATAGSGGGPVRASRTVVVLSALLLAATVGLVSLTLRREPPLSFPVTPPRPAEVGDRTVGPLRVTVDATRADRWSYFDFSRGSVVEDPGPRDWDIAFRRFDVMANGGAAFRGQGAVADLGDVPLDALGALPDSGWVAAPSRRDSVNPAVDRWYDYGFTSHLLTPRPRTWGLRTADGRFAALRFLSYYCPGAEPGCITFAYVYRGDGGRALRPTDEAPRPDEPHGEPAGDAVR